MAKILVLSTHDSHLGGHGWSTSEYLGKRGHEVYFLSLQKTNKQTENYFYDITNFFGRLKYYFFYYYRDLITKKIFLRPNHRYHFLSSYLWGMSSKSILKKVPFTPEYIVITWVAGFLTPKIIRDLYNTTRAKIVFYMVDEAILSVCHYHKDCNKFLSGCTDCPNVKGLKSIPHYVMEQKMRYWTTMPADIVGTTCEGNLARKLSFLQNKTINIHIEVPKIDYISSKEESRLYFNISNDDFVIFIGANNIKDVDKGYPYVNEALNKLIVSLNSITRPITLLVLGHGANEVQFNLDERINVIRRDFLPREHFFKAYYACDVHASGTLYDSGPMMVNYSLACGRPVVSFPVGVAEDLVIDGKTGYMAKFKDTSSFAEGLYKLYTMSDDNYNKIVENCKNHILCYEGKGYFDNIKL